MRIEHNGQEPKFIRNEGDKYIFEVLINGEKKNIVTTLDSLDVLEKCISMTRELVKPKFNIDRFLSVEEAVNV